MLQRDLRGAAIHAVPDERADDRARDGSHRGENHSHSWLSRKNVRVAMSM